MPAVIYPANLKTDKDKLFACYSLIEQLRLEYNKVSAIAASDKERYAGKFRAYADKAEDYFKQVLAERNSLIEKIRWANYTLEEWKQVSKLSFEEQDAIYKTLFGDRQAERVKPTLATSPLLAGLKATSLDDMPSKLGNDPVEDFTTYTEVDPGADIAIDANTITYTNLETTTDTFYVYKDKTADHFNGDFEHRVKILTSAQATLPPVVVHWMLTNDVLDMWGLINGSKNALISYEYGLSGSYPHYILEVDAGTQYHDGLTTLSLSIVYFLTIKRDEAVGPCGTFYEYICTTNYYGEVGAVLVDTLSLTLNTSKKDFRYVFGLTGYDINNPLGYTATGYVEDLDLREVAATVPFRNYYPSILAH